MATHDLWPDELVDDITGSFDDLRGRWPQVEWWVRRVHEASASSSMPPASSPSESVREAVGEMLMYLSSRGGGIVRN